MIFVIILFFALLLFSGFIIKPACKFSHVTENKNSKILNVDDARKILGVSSNADNLEINKAYKKLMAKFHPDHGGSEYLAIKINLARDLLLKNKN